jgi:hypothetical protein
MLSSLSPWPRLATGKIPRTGTIAMAPPSDPHSMYIVLSNPSGGCKPSVCEGIRVATIHTIRAVSQQPCNTIRMVCIVDACYLFAPAPKWLPDSSYSPLRSCLLRSKFKSVAIQTSPIEETFSSSPPTLCRDSGSSASSSPDPESDGDGTYASKGGLKRKK